MDSRFRHMTKFGQGRINNPNIILGDNKHKGVAKTYGNSNGFTVNSMLTKTN